MSSKKYGLLVLLAGIILLSACNLGAAATPTEAPEAIYTRVAATVQANITLTAAAMPTATATTAPTNTATPTNTQLPTVNPGTGTPGAGINTVAPGTTVMPTLTVISTQSGTHSGDHAVFQYQQPADGTTFTPGQEFSVAWGLKNDGGTTWSTGYTWHWLSGTQIQSATYPVAADVAPNARYEFFVAGIAPTAPGEYTTHWALFNTANQMVPGSEVYLRFIVSP